MLTTTETLTIDGVDLNTLAKNVSTLAGRLRRPAFRTTNVIVPGRHGNLWVPNKKYDVNVLALQLWVRGCDDDGNVPTSAREEFYANVDTLTKLFSSPDLLDVRHVLPDGSIRQCFGEVLDLIDIDTSGVDGKNPRGNFGVALTLPYPFWQDLNAIDHTFTPAGGTTIPLDMTVFEGGTAPIEDAVISITGPVNNPGILTPATSFEYSAVVAAGTTLILDCGEWELSGTSMVPNGSDLLHSGDARWCVIPADPAASLTNTGGITAATRVEIVARRKYMVG